MQSEMHRSTMSATPSTQKFSRLCKIIGVISIVALTLAAVESSAQESNSLSTHPKERVCASALNTEQTEWDQGPLFLKYVAEAKRRGLTVEACRKLAQPAASAPKQTVAGACPAPYSNPVVRSAATKELSELRNAAHLPYLSRQGIAEALAHKVHEVIYNAGLSGGAWPQPVSVDTLQACYPGLSDLLREETLRREAENRRKELERIEAAKPIKRQAYFNYMVVKRCYDVRLGYQLVYINEVELERAKEAVSAIETSAVQADSSIDTGNTWQEGVRMIGASKQYVEEYFCKRLITIS